MGHDDFGDYIGQRLNAYLFTDPTTGLPITGPPCTAPDGTAGETYSLEFALFVNSYNFKPDQLWGIFPHGHPCGSNTTGSNSESEEFTVLGGSGRFTGATGTITIKQSLVVGVFYYSNFPPFPPPIICLTGLLPRPQGSLAKLRAPKPARSHHNCELD